MRPLQERAEFFGSAQWWRRWQLLPKLQQTTRLGGIPHQYPPTQHCDQLVQENELLLKPHLSPHAVIARRMKEETRSTRLEISAHTWLASARLGDDSLSDVKRSARGFVRERTLSRSPAHDSWWEFGYSDT